jgi:predicted extracellular nuclease
MKKAFRSILPAFVILTMLLAALPVHSVQAVSANVVISQVYGGGGNNGAVYTNDFVELYNLGSTTVSLAGWSIQYASATGTGNFGSTTTQITPLSGSIAPGQYILIQEAAGSNVAAALPTPDITDSTPINLSGTGGKVALVNTATSLGCNGGSAPCSPAQLAQIVDLVGWDGANFYEGAPAPATTNPTAVLRNSEGCAETDNNAADFSVGTPAPRNSASPFHSCPTEPVPTNPTAVGSASPNTLFTGDTVLFTLSITGGTNPDSTGLAATCDLSAIGGAADQVFFDDGTNGDATAGDNTFSFSTTVAAITTSGAKLLACSVTDAEDRSGNASINLTVTQIIPIGAVNGAVSDTEEATLHRSPFAPGSGNGTGTAVITVQGVVFEKTMQAGTNTAYGIFIQNTAATADGDPNTSDGLFVYMGKFNNISGPSGYYVPQVGDELIISGKISEYYNMTEMSASLKILKVVRSGVDIDAEVAPVVANPTADLATANRYWERLQGMRVQVPQNSVVLGGRNVFSPADAEVWVAAPDSTVALRSGYEQRAFRDSHPLDDNYNPTLWDGNGYRILMGSLGIKAAAGDAQTLIDPARTFDTVTSAPAGGLNYTFSKYRIEISDQPVYSEGIDPSQNNPVQAIADRAAAYSIVDYNLENLYDYRNNPFSGCDFTGDTGCPISGPFLSKVSSPFDYVPASAAAYQARVADIASQIINDLHEPDILMLQEVENQDFCAVADGALTCGTTDNADGKPDVLQDLALEIAAQGGPVYDAAFDRDSSDLRGILPAYLYRTDRVELLPAANDPILGLTPAITYAGAGVPANSDVSNPKTLNAVLPAGVTPCETSWVFPRAASVALFRIYSDSVGDGNFTDVYTINNHFKSGPDTCVDHRTEQAKYNAAIISYIESVNPFAQIVMGGDLNVYPEPDNTALGAPEQLGSLYAPELGLKNLWEVLLAEAPASAYSYVYLGMAQTLDQMFVNQPLLNTMQEFKIAHINSDFPADYPDDFARGTSDHDPNAATFALEKPYGFITGSGWFKSPVDGYKAKFDVMAKYMEGAAVPDGATELILGKNMTLSSTAYDWLLQFGSEAVLKGTGTINGEGEYFFLITEKDGSPDQIKILIWDASGIVYDTTNLVNIGGGSITLH